MKNEENQPVKKVRSGRISISVWQRNISRNDGEAVELQRVCLQHSMKDKQTGEWRNQQIWLNVDELRSVAEAIDKMNGEDSSPSFSWRVHCIMEYIKISSLDAGLDACDLDEMSSSELLREYGIRVGLLPWEESMIKRELKALLMKQEFAEMAHCFGSNDSISSMLARDATVRWNSLSSSVR